MYLPVINLYTQIFLDFLSRLFSRKKLIIKVKKNGFLKVGEGISKGGSKNVTECIHFYTQTSSNRFLQKTEWWHFTSLNGKYPLKYVIL